MMRHSVAAASWPQFETGIISQLADIISGGPEKRARAKKAAQAAQAAQLERAALEQEMAWMQQAAQQHGLDQAMKAQMYMHQKQLESAQELESQRQKGQVKMLVGAAAVGLVGVMIWSRRSD